LKHVLSVFLSAFASVLRIVPKNVFRVRRTAVLAIFSVATLPLAAHAQTSEWTWMDGSTTQGSIAGVYGTLGTAEAGNTPGSRSSSVTWTGQDGTFWLFGGVGTDANNAIGILNGWESGVGCGWSCCWQWRLPERGCSRPVAAEYPPSQRLRMPR